MRKVGVDLRRSRVLAIIGVLLVGVLIGTFASANNDRSNEPPKIKVVLLPDGEQDSAYFFNLTATDPDDDVTDLEWSDDSDLIDVNQTGTISARPSNGDVGYNYFNVTVEDPGGLNDTLEFTLFIINVNDPPSLKYIPPQEALEDQEFSLNISEYVEDPDLLLPSEFRDRITYRDDTVKLDTNVETGEVKWRPRNEDVGEFFFTMTVTDSKGRSAQTEIKITIENTPDAPVIGIIGRQNLVQGRPYEFTIPFTDDDLDVYNAMESLTFSNSPTGLFIINATSGTIMCTPTNAHVGIWEITLTVTDSTGLSDSRLVVFDVENENDKPTIEYMPAQQLFEDVPFEMQIVASDPDLEERKLDGEPVDEDEVLTYRANVTRVQIDSEGMLTFTPNNEDAKHRIMVVRITVVDASSESATANVMFAIENINDAPTHLQIIGIIPGQTVILNEKRAMRGTSQDVDTHPDALSYTWYIDDKMIGQVQDIIWTPTKVGLVNLTLVVDDSDGGVSELTVQVFVKSDNQPPFDLEILGVDDGHEVRTDRSYPISASVKDDQDDVDSLGYIWYLGDILLSTSRSFQWTPDADGPLPLILTVTDKNGSSSDTSILLVVLSIPVLPEISGPLPDTIIDEDDYLTFILEFNESSLDPDKEYTITISSNISGHLLTIDAEEEMDFDAGRLPPGDHQLTVVISDGENEATMTLDITVKKTPKKTDSPGFGIAIMIGVISISAFIRMNGWWLDQG